MYVYAFFRTNQQPTSNSINSRRIQLRLRCRFRFRFSRFSIFDFDFRYRISICIMVNRETIVSCFQFLYKFRFISLYHCNTVSLYHCINVSLYHCITVSLYHCINWQVILDDRWCITYQLIRWYSDTVICIIVSLYHCLNWKVILDDRWYLMMVRKGGVWCGVPGEQNALSDLPPQGPLLP